MGLIALAGGRAIPPPGDGLKGSLIEGGGATGVLTGLPATPTTKVVPKNLSRVAVEPFRFVQNFPLVEIVSASTSAAPTVKFLIVSIVMFAATEFTFGVKSRLPVTVIP